MEELEAFYDDRKMPIPEVLEDAFSGIDVDDDGYITYIEFLSATLPNKIRCNETFCRRVFELMDRNDDGYIDASDLSQERCEWIEPSWQATIIEACAAKAWQKWPTGTSTCGVQMCARAAIASGRKSADPSPLVKKESRVVNSSKDTLGWGLSGSC
eukprot:g14917.t1